MKKLLALLLALTLVFALFAGCTSTAPESTDEPADVSTPEIPAEVTEVEFTDSVGRTVTLPSEITRVAPSGSLAQMFLIAIAPDLMVSVASGYSEDAQKYVPESLLSLPEVGQFYGSDDLNFETIASIAPDVVIDVGEPKDTIVEDMDSITEKLAIPAVHVTAALDSTPEAFRTLGKLLGREDKGEELAAFCEKILAQADEVMTAVGTNKKSALFLLGDAGTNVMAQGSFHSEVFDYVTDNAAVVDSPSGKGSGNETDLEAILVWNPDVIFFYPNSVYASVADDPTWKQLSAIANGSYYEIPSLPYNWAGSPPSINRYLTLIWLPSVLYPDAAGYDAAAEIAQYYKLFYGYDLSDDEFAAIAANTGLVK
ncbi:MAG: ABC transporter substrate-binding protein [Oscillospiraceae bacterium]|jgi:iron complex transport system substrate-binding protein|nr:ABC transporter substrate-binding protein [Oscillospiraceae bacterium]